jgi:ribonuclease VapC
VNKVIFDASALLALLNQEAGCEIVEKHLPHAIMSTVNISEVIAVLTEVEIPHKTAEEMVVEIIKEIVPFELSHALVSAAMRKMTKPYGLSFGDRACLTLAKLKNLPVLTADKIWGKINSDEIRVVLIR